MSLVGKLLGRPETSMSSLITKSKTYLGKKPQRRKTGQKGGPSFYLSDVAELLPKQIRKLENIVKTRKFTFKEITTTKIVWHPSYEW